MKNEISPALIRKYLNGECTPEEKFLLLQWYDSFEDQDDPFTTLSADEQEVLKLAMLNRFRTTALPADTDSLYQSKNKTLVKWIYALSGVAAVFILVWGFTFFNHKHSLTYGGTVATTVAERMLINNLTNSIYKQTLSDGSVVWLSPNSQLEFPKKFAGATRDVKMMGEAFFQVSKDHSHPFIINSGGVITRVWGTSFRIRSLQNSPTEVSVLTGKVSVKIPEKDNSEVMLYPRQDVIYLKDKALLKKATQDDRSLQMWKSINLSFDNIKLGSVINTLNEKFDVHIYTNDEELSGYLLKADFTDQNLPAILDMMESSLNTAYTINGKEIVLSKKQPITNQ